MSIDALTNILIGEELMNYFLVRQYTNELIQAHLLEIDDKNQLQVTKKGHETLAYFTEPLPKEVEDKIHKGLEKVQEESYLGLGEMEKNRPLVHLQIIEKDQPVFQCTLPVKDDAEGHRLINKIKTHPKKSFQEIMGCLKGDS